MPEPARGVALGVEIDDEDVITTSAPARSRGPRRSWSCRRRPSGSRRRSSGPLSALLEAISRDRILPSDASSLGPMRAGDRSLPTTAYRGGYPRVLHVKHRLPRTSRIGQRPRHEAPPLPGRRGRGILRRTSPPISVDCGNGQVGRDLWPLRRGNDPSHDPAARCGRCGGDGAARTHGRPIPSHRGCPATSRARLRCRPHDRGRARGGLGLGLRRRARARCPCSASTRVLGVRAAGLCRWRGRPGPVLRIDCDRSSRSPRSSSSASSTR